MPKNNKKGGFKPPKNYVPRGAKPGSKSPSHRGYREDSGAGKQRWSADDRRARDEAMNGGERGGRFGAPRDDRGARGADERPRYSRDERGGRGERSGFNRDDRGDRARFSRDDRGDRGGFNRDDRGERPRFNRGDRDERPRFARGDRDDRPRFSRDDRDERPRFNRDDRGGDRPRFNRDERGERPRFNRDDRGGERPRFNRDDRGGDRPRFTRDDRGERPRFNRDDRGERARFDRGDRDERPRFTRDDRGAEGGREGFRRDDEADRAARDERRAKRAFERRDRDFEQRDRGDRPEREARPDRPERPRRDDRSPRAEGRFDRPERSDRRDRGDRPERPHRHHDRVRDERSRTGRGARDAGASWGSDELVEKLEATKVSSEVASDVTWETLGLGSNISRTLEKMGAARPFPIQAATIPDVLGHRHVLGRGKTGSGKTIAFGAPLVERLMEQGAGKRRDMGRAPRALVLAPTRELALQIDGTVQPIAQSVGLFTTQIYGGVPQARQVGALKRGVDIVIGTPGRIEDLMAQRRLDLSHVEVVVVDEADHMCELGFLEPVQRILRETSASSQKLLFSATLDKRVASLVEEFLENPAVYEIEGEDQASSTIEHHVIVAQHRDKGLIIEQLADRPGKTVIFTRTRAYAEMLSDELQDAGLRVTSLHGDLNQSRRTRNLERLANGRADVLVATDVAARGIHVDDVTLVIQADAPDDYKTYLHRAGRTGRAGAHGKVVTIIPRQRQRRMSSMLDNADIDVDFVDVQPGDEMIDAIGQAEGPLRAQPEAPIEEAPQAAQAEVDNVELTPEGIEAHVEAQLAETAPIHADGAAHAGDEDASTHTADERPAHDGPEA